MKHPASQPPEPLATITGGSLDGGLEARLNAGISTSKVRLGMCVVVQGGQQEQDGPENRYICWVVDISLLNSNPHISKDPPLPSETLLIEILQGTSVYTVLKLMPMVQLIGGASPGEENKELDEGDRPQLLPVKSLPPHFAPVYLATEHDISQVFGHTETTETRYFPVGTPLEMTSELCLDLDKWAERSNGIFGKTGTGKSFLARVILAGIIQTRAAVTLIFDMHSEYGWEATSEGRESQTVKGLKQLFPGQVELFTLDPDSTQRRGVRDAWEVAIALSEIEVEDLALLKDELNLTQTSLENAAILRNELGLEWMSRLLQMSNGEIQQFCEQRMGHKASMMALQRKLMRLQAIGYLVGGGVKGDRPTSTGLSSQSNGHRNGTSSRNGKRHKVVNSDIARILAALESGKHVVIEFGARASALSYMLASNIITRHIHRSYIQKSEHYLYSKNPADKPQPLAIAIEEAHRFLGPKTCKQTIYGAIAREMRKYFVTLLVIDQRPSGIDSEVLSQLGTRITALLDDERDVEAVLTGVAGGRHWRGMVSRLAAQRQAMIFGQAVPMPVAVETRLYDEEFYRQVGAVDWASMEDEVVVESGDLARDELGL